MVAVTVVHCSSFNVGGGHVSQKRSVGSKASTLHAKLAADWVYWRPTHKCKTNATHVQLPEAISNTE
jgi:hypothetical protein